MGEVFEARGRTALFLILTFALSWGFDPLLTRLIGHHDVLELGLAPWSMLVLRDPVWRTLQET